MPAPLHVLVLCTGNSARSQIAEALLATLGGGRLRAGSAGSRPAPRVNPGAVAVLADRGIDWQGRTPRTVDAALAEGPWDLVITVCDDAAEACPVLPGVAARVHWGLPDPAVPEGEARTAAFAATYAALDARVRALLALPLETLAPAAIAQAAAAIHSTVSAA